MSMYVCIERYLYVFLYSSCTQRTSARANEQNTAHDCAVLITLLLQLLLRLSAAELAQISLSLDACLVQQLLRKTRERFCEFWRENWFQKKIKSYIFFSGGGVELGWIGFGDMSIFLSTNQSNSWEKKLPGRG